MHEALNGASRSVMGMVASARAITATPARRSRLSRRFAVRGAHTAYFYILPMLILLGLFTYWPLVSTVGLSVVRWNLNPDIPMKFVGAANYERLWSSPLFHDALASTLYYLLASFPLKVLFPLVVAYAIWGLGKSGLVYRTILFLPTLASFVVVSVVFLWLLNPLGGMVPMALQAIGLPSANPLSSPGSALWTILLISTWKVLGFNVLIYLAGLTRIRPELIEAMRIDGAGDRWIFTSLIWPLLAPTTFFVLVSTTIFSMQQVFTPIDIMTQGGPQNATTNLFYMVFQLTFRTFDVGLGAAGTTLLFALLFALTLFKFRVLDRRIHYDN